MERRASPFLERGLNAMTEAHLLDAVAWLRRPALRNIQC